MDEIFSCSFLLEVVEISLKTNKQYKLSGKDIMRFNLEMKCKIFP